jgi:SAM-dependent methyltransferase
MPVGRDSNGGLETCNACLFCGNGTADLALTGVSDVFFNADPGTYDIMRCRDCASLWLPLRPVGERLLKAYGNYYTHAYQPVAAASRRTLRHWVRTAYFRSRFEGIATPLERLVARALTLRELTVKSLDWQLRHAPPPPAKVLDYGCGSGRFFSNIRGLGYALYGVEYDPHLLDAFARDGIQVEDAATIRDDRWHEEFDYITLAHVLEHVPDPRALLRRLFGWLKPGGGLYIELPNAEATGLEVFGPWWRGLEAPRHFSLPSRSALVNALEASGFTIERHIDTSGSRKVIWQQSLAAVPEGERAGVAAAMAAAPEGSQANAELLIIVARRPRA